MSKPKPAAKLTNGHLQGATLRGMRETAFGKGIRSETFAALDRMEKGRDDNQLLADAEAKRLRKAAARTNK